MSHEENEMIGREIYDIAGEIFPIHRSLTGNGVCITLQMLKKYMYNMEIHEIASGLIDICQITNLGIEKGIEIAKVLYSQELIIRKG